MREVANGDLAFLVDGCEERSFVVDAEGEDAVLVGGREGGGEGCAVRSG